MTAPVCLFIALGTACWAAACTARTPAASQERTLRIGVRGADEAPAVLRSLLFAEGLLALGWDGRPSERLARIPVEWSEDGLTLRVRLRPGVRFHDGTAVTAPLVLKILKQKIAQTQAGFEAVSSIEAPSDDSLLFHLNRPDGFLTSALASTLIVDDDKPDIGTGPYRLVPQSKGLQVVQNASYYRGAPGLDRIEVKPYATARASWGALLRGEVDMALDVNKESVEFFEGASRFEKNSSIQPYYIPLVFNFRNPILARPEVRRAIAEAVDRDEIVAQGMRGRGKRADDPVWPLHWAYNTAAWVHNYDPAGARERLDMAGLPIKAAVAGRRASRFQLKCMFYSQDPQFERIALLLQRQLAAVGIDLVLEGLKGKDMVARLSAGEFDSYLFQLTSGRDLSWVYSFWHSPKGALGQVMQNTGYSGADTVLDALRQARDDRPEDIRVAVGDVRQRFYEDVPAVFLAWTENTRVVDTRFDIVNPNDPEIFANLWRWQLASQQTASR